MTRPSADRVKAVWVGTGTGTMSLGGAAPGEAVQAFPAALDGHIVRYVTKHETALEAESGYGLYTHSGATLSRLYRTSPTLGGAAVSFSAGNKFVSVTDSHIDIVVNESTSDPTASDSISTGFLRGHMWLNTSTQTTWICVVHTAAAAVWSRLDGAGITLDQHDIIARLVAGSGHGAAVAAADLTEHLTPGAGDMVLLWAGGTTLRKSNLGNLTTTADAAPTLVTSNAATFALASTARLHQNIIVTSHQASVVFEVPLAAAANSEWRIMPRHDGCTVTKAAGSGSITPSPARIINGGLVIVTVISNAGSAPVIEVRGEVIVPSTSVTTKTYDADDDKQDFTATGTQTFSAAVNYPNGFYVNIWNTGAGSISITGADATHTLPVHGVATVKKRGDGALVCNGSSATSPNTLLDAS